MDEIQESFPFYLSSNACRDIYPNNSPTDFRTRLSHPLKLQGKWECGLKSVAYSSDIHDANDTGRIDCLVTTSKSVDINSIYGYEFTTWRNKWRGLVGFKPSVGSVETNPKNWRNVITSLNSMEKVIVKRKVLDIPIFKFDVTNINNQTFVCYQSYDQTFAMKITEAMSRFLGFFPIRQFEGSAMCFANKPIVSNDKKPLLRSKRTPASRVSVVQPKQSAVSTSHIGLSTDQTVARNKKIQLPIATASFAESTPIQTTPETSKKVASKITNWLESSDYHVKYFSSNIQKLQFTAHIKKGQEETLAPDFANNFCKIWSQEVTKRCPGITAEIKGNKIVLKNSSSDQVVKLSRNLMVALTGGKNPHWMWTYRKECPCIIFSHDSTVQFDISTFSKPMNQKLTNWFVEIYSDELDKTHNLKNTEVSVFVRPWHHKSLDAAIGHINQEVTKTIKGLIPLDYQLAEHNFALKMISPTRAIVEHGKFLIPKFSTGLAQLLGFSESNLSKSITHADRDVDSLENHRRNLVVLSEMVAPTFYGEKQYHILRSFLHKGGGPSIVEKEFRPIMYQPLMTNCFEEIHVQIVSEDYAHFKIKDIDTIIVLHFRPVE